MPTQEKAKYSYPKQRNPRQDSFSIQQKHIDAVQRKHEKLGMLQALLETWEKRPKRDIKYEHDLIKRIRTQRVQLLAMK